MQIKLKSCVTLFIAYMFINKLLMLFFYRMVFNTERIHNSFEEISSAEGRKQIGKVSLLGTSTSGNNCYIS